MSNLYQKLNEKLDEKITDVQMKRTVQGLIGLAFVNQTTSIIANNLSIIRSHSEQIIDIAGEAGYVATAIGASGLAVATTGLLGYVAVKGAGMFMDEVYAANPKKAE